MSDIFADRPFPGYPNRPPRDPGPWEDFAVSPPWDSDSVLRVRTLYAGRSVQFAGTIVAELQADTEAWLGVLSAVFRPAQTHHFIVPTTYGQWADLEIESDGWVVLRARRAMTATTFRRVYPLELALD
jgi:hypothetical protein